MVFEDYGVCGAVVGRFEDADGRLARARDCDAGELDREVGGGEGLVSGGSGEGAVATSRKGEKDNAETLSSPRSAEEEKEAPDSRRDSPDPRYLLHADR